MAHAPRNIAELFAHVDPLDAAVEHEVGELVDGAEVSDEGAAVAKQDHLPFVEFLEEWRRARQVHGRRHGQPVTTSNSEIPGIWHL